MRLYLLSPQGVPPNQHLFPMFIETWKNNGVEIVDRMEDCDIVLMDLHSRLAKYKQEDINWLILHGKKIVTFDEWDRGNLSTDQWPEPLIDQQETIFKLVRRGIIDAIHFCRLLDKTKSYPPNLFPYEKPILYEKPLFSSDELFNREFDIVFIANYSPSRQAIAEAFQADHRLRTFISIGAKKKPFDEFVDWHKRGKLFVSSGAGGYGNERPQYLFSIAGLIQEETDQLLLHKFYDGLTCIKIDNPPTKEQLDEIYEVVNNKGKLYSLYYNCYNYMKKFYSAEYIATDILSKIKQHLS